MEQDLPVKTNPSEQGFGALPRRKKIPLSEIADLIEAAGGDEPFHLQPGRFWSRAEVWGGPEVTARSQGHRLSWTLVRGAGHRSGAPSGCWPDVPLLLPSVLKADSEYLQEGGILCHKDAACAFA